MINHNAMRAFVYVRVTRLPERTNQVLTAFLFFDVFAFCFLDGLTTVLLITIRAHRVLYCVVNLSTLFYFVSQIAAAFVKETEKRKNVRTLFWSIISYKNTQKCFDSAVSRVVLVPPRSFLVLDLFFRAQFYKFSTAQCCTQKSNESFHASQMKFLRLVVWHKRQS